MKRITAFLLLAIMLLSMTACGKESSAAASTDASASAPEALSTTAPETQRASEPVVTEASPAGFLYLTVSRITFSVIGESEDVYIGTIPREEITWTTEDETVAVFDNGVLTATGVGETVACAQWEDQQLQCIVGCLAEDAAALANVGEQALRSPKRMPPEVSSEPFTYYNTSALVGDSITYVMFQYNNQSKYLGSPQFLCRGSASVNGLVKNFHKIYFRGVEMPLEESIALSGVEKVFFMLGQNDMGYQSLEEIMDNWAILVDRILEKSPEVEIYLQSCTPGWVTTASKNGRNEKIDEYNLLLKEFAQERGLHYVELAAYVEDHNNKLATDYCSDKDVHLSELGSNIWMQVLKAYAEYQLMLAASPNS